MVRTGHGSGGLGCQVEGGVTERSPANTVLGPHLVVVGLAALQVLDQQHSFLCVINLHLLVGTHGLCADKGRQASRVKNPGA